MTKYKGDNWQAFDGRPITVELEDLEEDVIITRALVVINKGTIVREYINPIFPLEVELDENDTKKLLPTNTMNLIVYDRKNRKMTCDGMLQFRAKTEVYNESSF